MSTQAQAVKELETLFLKAKHRDSTKYDSNEDKHIVVDAYNAMSKVEEHEYVELIPYLYHFIDDRDGSLRVKALQSLGSFRADQTPEFTEIAFNIWNNKNDERDIRGSALSLWSGSYQLTEDPKALKILYRVLKDKNAESSIRCRALIGIMRVIGDEERYVIASNLWFKIYGIKDPYEFDTKINWEEVEGIMYHYVPEVLKGNNLPKAIDKQIKGEIKSFFSIAKNYNSSNDGSEKDKESMSDIHLAMSTLQR
jgi:hypothetical protein